MISHRKFSLKFFSFFLLPLFYRCFSFAFFIRNDILLRKISFCVAFNFPSIGNVHKQSMRQFG